MVRVQFLTWELPHAQAWLKKEKKRRKEKRRKGKKRKGKERKGKERKGKERKGKGKEKERKGKEKERLFSFHCIIPKTTVYFLPQVC